ncbi:MAG: deaminase [Sporomusaceae bacterium]|nr:deaminase [Sporomusaceae bacterium]
MVTLRTRFLIVGTTGPLGSGCSSISKMLSTDLNFWLNFTKDKNLKSIDDMIGKYYEYIRKIQGEEDLALTTFKNENKNLIVEPSKLFEALKEHRADYHYLSDKKSLNRKLRELLQARDTLAIVCRANFAKFTQISMSDMIMKLAIKHAIFEGRVSSEITNCSFIPEKARSLITQFAFKYLVKMQEFDEKINFRKFDALTEDYCAEVDEWFTGLNKLKEELSMLEDMSESWLQDFGDNVRATGNPFVYPEPKHMRSKFLDVIASEANRYIKYMGRRITKSSSHFIIDTFRNPAEVQFFRKRYGSFYLISVYLDQQVRHKRKKFSESRDERDQGKDNKPHELFKQNVSSCVTLSDYAVTNDGDEERLWLKIARLLALIELPGSTTPTFEETFMNMAYNLSVRSNCLSRQVGAVITNKDGFVVGAGWNDVGSGQLGCARRRVSDLKQYAVKGSLLSVWEKQFNKFMKEELLVEFDERDCFCFKDIQSRLETVEKIDKLWKKFLEDKSIYVDKSKRESMLPLKEYFRSQLNIKRLEFARALHAEENAILQVATHGGMGIREGTIFTTTFPCELCAKKIYQSGITRIVYTEPYPDSLSESIFLRDGIRRIECDQFEGVKANSYFKLFKPTMDHKDFRLIEENLDM